MALHPVRHNPSRMSAAWAIALTIGALYFGREVLIPIALSILLAFLLAPIVNRLERRGLPGVWSVIVTVTVAFTLILGLGYGVGTQVYNLGELLQDNQTQDRIVSKATSVRQWFGGSGGLGEKIAEIGEKIDREAAKSTTQATTTRPQDDAGVSGAAKEAIDDPVASVTKTDSPVVATTRPAVTPAGTADRPFYAVALPAPLTPIELVNRYMGTILGPLGNAGLVIVFVIFVLLEREQLRDRMIRLVSGGNYTATTAAINDATGRITRYILAQSIVNGTYGIAISIGLWIIGRTVGGEPFPSFLLWGLLCAVLRFIPYIGPWVAAAFPIVLSLAVYDGFDVFLTVLAMFVVIELFSNNVMEPWLYGSSTGLSTVAILVAAVFWTWLWGPIGLLLSTPLTVCIVVLGRYTTQLKFLDVMLSDRPALPPPVRFYQRLLANDEREARQIVTEVAAEHGWGRAGDEVIVPAMTLIRRDRRNDHLDAAGEAEIVSKIRDLTETFAHDAEKQVAAEAKEEAAGPAGDVPPESSPSLVLAFPSHHRSEEAALRLVPLGTDARQIDFRVGSTRQLAGDIIAQVRQDRPAAIVLGIVPPGGLIQTRYLCRRLRRTMPDIPIIVAYFGRTRHFDKLLRRLRSSGVSYVTTSIVQTQSQLLASIQTRKPHGPTLETLANAAAPKFVDGDLRRDDARPGAETPYDGDAAAGGDATPDAERTRRADDRRDADDGSDASDPR